jgi:uncharacterized membrane protein YdbT with pleckstrin-like domain
LADAPNRRSVDDEHVLLDARRHGVLLARPFLRSVGVMAVGTVLLFLPWPLPLAGPALVAAGAIAALAAVWRWDRTRLVVTTEKVFVVEGVARRRASAVMLRQVQEVSLEQTLAGRMLGYGTLHAGPLEVSHVADARQVCRLVESLVGAT